MVISDICVAVAHNHFHIFYKVLTLKWRYYTSFLRDVDEVLVAAEIRVALDRIGLVVGAVHTEDLLDRIFSRFCVGK